MIHYRGKRAVREVGRAMGLTEDTLSAMSSQIWGFGGAKGMDDQRACAKSGWTRATRRLRQTMALIEEIQGFPRHLSQHVGGFIITEGRLDELVPIENATMEDRTVICWDKDDIDTLGILKVDILALGMLSCLRKAFDLMEKHHRHGCTLATLPPEDPQTYDMLCQADSLGVFQVESRAQMNFLPRMRPRNFYDLVIQVAIIRPGPIQGDMVHPYLRRRNGQEVVTFPSDALGAGAGQDAGRAAVSGTGDADRHHRRRLHPDRGRPAAAVVGDVQETRLGQRISRPLPGGDAGATAMTPISPPAVSRRSRALAAMAFPKAMRPVLPCWSMPRPGSSGIIPASLPARC